VIVDHYFVILEDLGGRTEEVEEEVLEDPQPETQERINDLRRDLIFMRRMTWPVRELLSQLERLDSPLWSEDTRPFVRDTYDHAVQVLDLVESLRDVVGGLTDLYMTSLSNRMNEIMKVLTIMGTIFIPLTFIAGIYGMNFEYMPELTVWYGYPVAMTVMLVIAGALLVYFRTKDWI
jgi:magnesium transporter